MNSLRAIVLILCHYERRKSKEINNGRIYLPSNVRYPGEHLSVCQMWVQAGNQAGNRLEGFKSSVCGL